MDEKTKILVLGGFTAICVIIMIVRIVGSLQ